MNRVVHLCDLVHHSVAIRDGNPMIEMLYRRSLADLCLVPRYFTGAMPLGILGFRFQLVNLV